MPTRLTRASRWLGRRDPRVPPAPFIVGVGRSGTTLLRLMLDAHPEMAVPPETHFLPDLLDAADRGASSSELVELLAASRRWADFGLDTAEVQGRLDGLGSASAAEAARAVYGLYAQRQGKSRWGDKTPKYSLVMTRIQRALPEARFVHLLRDGRDVALSRMKMVEGRGGNPPDPQRVVRRWRRRIQQARDQSRKLRHYLEIRYEDLVTDTEPTLRRVCEFIELGWAPEMLRYHEQAGERLGEIARELPAKREGRDPIAGSHRLRVHALATEPPQRGRVANWKAAMSQEQQRACTEAAGELLAELGYEVAAPR